MVHKARLFLGILFALALMTSLVAPLARAPVLISPESVDVVEGGATAIYVMILSFPPTAEVTVTISPDAQLSVTPTTLTFTPADWLAAQTVTVSAVDDAVFEGPHSGKITHRVSSTDSHYGGSFLRSVSVNIGDNELSPVVVPAIVIAIITAIVIVAVIVVRRRWVRTRKPPQRGE